jgi:serine/threonine protein phosphatase 1
MDCDRRLNRYILFLAARVRSGVSASSVIRFLLTAELFHGRTPRTMRPFFSQNSRSIAASTPADTRIYAVGDIHGRADLLIETIACIDEDRIRRPIGAAFEVYLGDYIDRGPDSKAVIDLLSRRLVEHRAVCLCGNHEDLMASFIQDPASLPHWRKLGGMQTLASYGVGERANETKTDLHRRFHEALPYTHQLFLRCLRDSFCCGDFLFVHAGIRPAIAIEQQQRDDLLWIRHEFLNSNHDHGKFVVHGHTPVPHPDIRHNRINIDTGAWHTGTLTCIAIEGTAFLVL